MFGLEFSNGYFILIILALGQFIGVLSGNTTNLLQMTGHHRELFKITLYTFVFVLLGGVILIPMFKIIGAAIIGCLAIALRNIFASIIVKNKLNINIYSAGKIFFKSK